MPINTTVRDADDPRRSHEVGDIYDLAPIWSPEGHVTAFSVIESHTFTVSYNNSPPKPIGEPEITIVGAISPGDLVEVWRAERQLRIAAEARAEKAEARLQRAARAARMARVKGHHGSAAAPVAG